VSGSQATCSLHFRPLTEDTEWDSTEKCPSYTSLFWWVSIASRRAPSRQLSEGFSRWSRLMARRNGSRFRWRVLVCSSWPAGRRNRVFVSRPRQWNYLYILRKGMDRCSEAISSCVGEAGAAPRLGCTDSRIWRAV